MKLSTKKSIAKTLVDKRGFSYIELIVTSGTMVFVLASLNQFGLMNIKKEKEKLERSSFASFRLEFEEMLEAEDATKGCSDAFDGEVYSGELTLNSASAKGQLAGVVGQGRKYDKFEIESIRFEPGIYTGPRPSLIYGSFVVEAKSKNPMMTYANNKKFEVPAAIVINVGTNEIVKCAGADTKLAKCFDLFDTPATCELPFWPDDLTGMNEFLNVSVCTNIAVSQKYCAWQGTVAAKDAGDYAKSVYENY